MRRSLVRLAILAVLALAACDDTERAIAPLPRIYVTSSGDTVPGNASVLELRAMRAKWENVRAGSDYRMQTRVTCFCGEEYTRPLEIEVHGDAVFSVRDLVSGQLRPTTDSWTIEALFDRAIAERLRGGRVRVTYLRSAGYPVWIEIGTPENDAGATYTVFTVRFAE